VSQDPSDYELSAVTAAWLYYTVTNDERYEWTIDPNLEWSTEGSLQLGWRLVLECCSLTDENDMDRILAIGAGPLEDFIRRFGDEAMDLVEPAVDSNPVLLKALAGVWGWDEPTRPRVDRVLQAHGQESL
jgi:hypothetical protein